MTLADVPNFAPVDWFLHEVVDKNGNALDHYADGSVRFRHLCDRGERGVIICAPLLQLDCDPVDLVCPDCGTHGFVVNGKWRAA